ncbi:MAG: hypothetical protein U9N56_07865 [Actinomycetota bacterium]|nr:hypothetical protein [Actinomycetota bacterium]
MKTDDQIRSMLEAEAARQDPWNPRGSSETMRRGRSRQIRRRVGIPALAVAGLAGVVWVTATVGGQIQPPAQVADAPTPAEILADGVVTEAEYEAAGKAVVDCVAQGTTRVEFTVERGFFNNSFAAGADSSNPDSRFFECFNQHMGVAVSEMWEDQRSETTSSSTFTDVHEMRDLVEAAGFTCDRWQATSFPGRPNPQNEFDSAICTLHSQFMVYYVGAPGAKVIEDVVTTAARYTNDGQTSAQVYGDNWRVDCSGDQVECDTIVSALGGTLHVVQGDPVDRDGDLLPTISCPTLQSTPTGPIAFFTLCNGDPGLPPIPIYQAGPEPTLEQAVTALVTSDFGPEGLTVDITLNSEGVARVAVLDESGQTWDPGSLTSHQVLSLFDPLFATVFHFPEVEGVDRSTLCWGETVCSGVTTREEWASTLFINTGALLTRECDLEAVWRNVDECTLQGAVATQHFETVSREAGSTVYAGPGTNFIPVEELELGDFVAVLERRTTDSEGAEWDLVLTELGTHGWMLGGVLESTELLPGSLDDPASQSGEDAERDGVVPELAALPKTIRSVPLLPAIATPEGNWTIEVPSSGFIAMARDNDCLFGNINGSYPTEVICTQEYGELLLSGLDGTILRAYPMPSAVPSWLLLTDQYVYVGHIGDGGNPRSVIGQVNRATYEPTFLVFGGDGQDWPTTWEAVDPTLYEGLIEITQVWEDSPQGRVLADSWIGSVWVDQEGLRALFEGRS